MRGSTSSMRPSKRRTSSWAGPDVTPAILPLVRGRRQRASSTVGGPWELLGEVTEVVRHHAAQLPVRRVLERATDLLEGHHLEDRVRLVCQLERTLDVDVRVRRAP